MLRIIVIDNNVNNCILNKNLDIRVLIKKILITFLIISQISCLEIKNEIFKFDNSETLSQVYLKHFEKF